MWRMLGALFSAGLPTVCGLLAIYVTAQLVDGYEGLGQGIGQLLSLALMAIAVVSALIGTATGLAAAGRPIATTPDTADGATYYRDFYRVSFVIGAVCLALGLIWLAWIPNLAPSPPSSIVSPNAEWVQTSWIAVTLGLILLCGPGLIALAESRTLRRAAPAGPHNEKGRPA